MSEAAVSAPPSATRLKAELAALTPAARTRRILESLKSEISSVLDIDAEFIDDNATLVDLGADSLRLVALVTRLQEIVGFAIPLRLLAPKGSLRELAELLAASVAQADPRVVLTRARSEAVAKEIEADIFLEAGTGSAKRAVTAAEALDPKAVFVTGATGFLGAYLVHELARRTQARIHCLVRAGDAAQALERVNENLRRFKLWAPEVEARIEIELGDLGGLRFGLSAERYTELAGTIDIIYHNGANVHLTNPYELVRAANVVGTRTILHLAGTVRRKPVAFISSVGIFDTPELEDLASITETTTPKDIGLLPNGYTQSKLAGERLADLARQAGIPVSILRVGHVIGEGVSQDLAGRMVQACLRAGAVPLLTHPIDYVPPDYTAAVIVEIPRRIGSSGIYHLTNPKPFTMDRLMELASLHPLPFRFMPIADWVVEVREQSQQDPQHPLFAAADMMDPSLGNNDKCFIAQVLSRPAIDCERTRGVMAATGLRCPPAEEILAGVLGEMPEIKALLSAGATPIPRAARAQIALPA